MSLQDNPQYIQLDCKGLYTMPNSLSQVPKGSLLQADNIVVSYNGLMDMRRGIKQYGTSLQTITGVPTTEVFQEFVYKNTNLIWLGDATASYYAPGRAYFAYDSDGLGTWVQTTHPFSPPAYTLTDTYRSVQSNNNFYITSSTGLLKTDAPANPLRAAGGLPGLDGSAVLVDIAGFMSTNTEVAYRMTWITTDTNQNAVEGVPSTRVVIANNSGGDRNVQLTFTIPKTATTANKWVIYRSLMSASGTTEPSDELQQVLQGYPSNTDITNGYFTTTDSLPESQLGAALYTNSGQQGITQANNIPPLATDVCFFLGYVVYGAATTQQTFLLSLLSAEPPSGIQVGDTFTITNGLSNFTLTGAVSENISLGYFQIFTGGDPASDIEQTKISLIHVLNRYNQTLVYAYDADSAQSSTALPGDFYIQEQGIGGGVFAVSSSRSTCWNPSLTTTPSDNPSLTGGSTGGGFCSKFQQPESVPISNTINVGNPSFEWLRALPLRNSIIVLKQDGLFQLTGPTYPFAVTTLDTGTFLTAPESCAIMNNQVFAYTNQGVVTVSETGPGIISRPIENILQPLSAYLHPTFPQVTFGTAYQTDRKYLLSTISDSDDFQKATQQFVYDVITETWTTYIYPIAVNDILESTVDQRLYVASATDTYPYVFRERKSFTQLDYADIELPTTIVSSNGLVVTLTSTSNVIVGWSLVQLSSDQSQILNSSVITEILNGTEIQVTDIINWDLSGGSFTALEQPIAVAVRYCPITGTGAYIGTPGNPGLIKFFKEVQFFFQDVTFNSVNVSFSSDFIANSSTLALVPVPATQEWGQFAWGQIPWGGMEEFAVSSVRTYIPLYARRAHWLNLSLSISQAMTNFTYGGCVVVYQDVTTRSK
jgi:hypothetical protein